MDVFEDNLISLFFFSVLLLLLFCLNGNSNSNSNSKKNFFSSLFFFWWNTSPLKSPMRPMRVASKRKFRPLVPPANQHSKSHAIFESVVFFIFCYDYYYFFLLFGPKEELRSVAVPHYWNRKKKKKKQKVCVFPFLGLGRCFLGQKKKRFCKPHTHTYTIRKKKTMKSS